MDMKKNSKPQERSLPTTIVAAVIGLGILAVSLLMLPIDNLVEGLAFGIGVILVILSAIVAIQGKAGSIKELLFSLSFWA